MIDFFVETDSYIGTTSSGITFSSDGVIVMGLSGPSTVFSTVTRDAAGSFNLGSTPIVFVDTNVLGTNLTFPTAPENGTTVVVIRTSISSSGTTRLFAGGTDTIRAIESSTNAADITITVNAHRYFFYYKGNANSGTWWEF